MSESNETEGKTTDLSSHISAELRTNIISLLDHVFSFHENLAGRSLSALKYADTPIYRDTTGTYIVYGADKSIHFISKAIESIPDNINWLSKMVAFAQEDGLVSSDDANQYVRPRARAVTPRGLPSCPVDGYHYRRSSVSLPDHRAA